MSALTPCPFCGCKNIQISYLVSAGFACMNQECGAVISFHDKKDIPAAVAAWNKRSNQIIKPRT